MLARICRVWPVVCAQISHRLSLTRMISIFQIKYIYLKPSLRKVRPIVKKCKMIHFLTSFCVFSPREMEFGVKVTVSQFFLLLSFTSFSFSFLTLNTNITNIMLWTKSHHDSFFLYCSLSVCMSSGSAGLHQACMEGHQAVRPICDSGQTQQLHKMNRGLIEFSCISFVWALLRENCNPLCKDSEFFP